MAEKREAVSEWLSTLDGLLYGLTSSAETHRRVGVVVRGEWCATVPVQMGGTRWWSSQVCSRTSESFSLSTLETTSATADRQARASGADRRRTGVD